jgi:hypothetical protein
VTVIETHRVKWRGIVFDSRLESDWAASLSHHGVEWRYHPPVLSPDGTVERYEPDFFLPPAHPELPPLWVEVKGAHKDRLWKVALVREAGYPVLVVGDLGSQRMMLWDSGGTLGDDVYLGRCPTCRTLHFGTWQQLAAAGPPSATYTGNCVEHLWQRVPVATGRKSGGRRVE